MAIARGESLTIDIGLPGVTLPVEGYVEGVLMESQPSLKDGRTEVFVLSLTAGEMDSSFVSVLVVDDAGVEYPFSISTDESLSLVRYLVKLKKNSRVVSLLSRLIRREVVYDDDGVTPIGTWTYTQSGSQITKEEQE